MCCVMGYTGHDLSAAKFKEYLLRTVMRGPDDQRVVEGPFGLMGFGRLAIMGLTPEGMQPFYHTLVVRAAHDRAQQVFLEFGGTQIVPGIAHNTTHISYPSF